MFLSALMDNLSDAFIATDMDLNIVHWNNAARVMYGWSSDEVLGRSIQEVIKTEYLDGDAGSALQQIMIDGVWINQVVQSRKDGGKISVHSTVSIMKSDTGQMVGLTAVNRDITEQKMSDERFRQTFESAPNAIILVNQKGDIVQVNSQVEKYFGYQPEELIGQSVDRLVPQRYSTVHPGHRTGFFSKPQVRPMGVGRDLYALRKDGSEFPVEIGLAPIITQDGTLVCATIVDITERIQADERFRLAVEAAPNAIIMVDQTGNIILVNSQVEKYFGYQRNELIGESIDRLVPQRYTDIHPEHRAGFFSSPKMRAMGVGRDLYALRKDGSEFPVEIGLAPIDTHGGMYVLSTIVDITERKRTEEETSRLNKELEAFAYSVSHDLRAPLRGIDGFSGMLADKYASVLDEKGVHYLSRIHANVKRMGQMIDDLLLLARMTSHDLRRENVNISTIANEILDELLSQTPGRSISFEVEEQIEDWCDTGLIRIVLQNLLGNAWKFTTKREDALIQFGRAPRDRFGKARRDEADRSRLHRRDYAGGAWGPSAALDDGPWRDEAPALARRDGEVWLLWHSDRTGRWELWARVHHGSDWGAPQRITARPEADKDPAVLADGTNLRVFWRRERIAPEYRSRTVDTGDVEALENLGRLRDRLHFTYDAAREDHDWYARDVAGLYLEPPPGTPDAVVEDVLERARSYVAPFCPATVRLVAIAARPPRSVDFFTDGFDADNPLVDDFEDDV
jgi:PAS domain S-box-containing protein